MDLNSIKLSESVVREWFKEDLLPPSAAAGQVPPVQPALKYLGNNRRRVTVVVGAPGSAFLPDDQLAFVTKLLEACRLTLADVAIVNHGAVPVTIAAIRQQLHPVTLLLFGVDPAEIHLPIQFPAFRPQAYDNCTYLAAPSLAELLPDTDAGKLLKSKLWVCLKTIFDV